jgi:hypothetical protein
VIFGRFRALPVVLALIVLGGCGTHHALAASWPALPAPSFAVSAVGDCFAGTDIGPLVVDVINMTKTDCAADHAVEIAGVHDLPAATSRPTYTDPAYRTAYTVCSADATAYLDGDWHAGNVYLAVWLASRAAWAAGDHHYSCAIGQDNTGTGNGPGIGSGSVHGGIANGTGRLARHCMTVIATGAPGRDGFYAEFDGLTPVGCDVPHDAEFTDVRLAPSGPYPTTQRQRAPSYQMCDEANIAMLGESRDHYLRRADISPALIDPGEAVWALGDRTLECYVLLPANHRITGSLRNLHGAPLPPAVR